MYILFHDTKEDLLAAAREIGGDWEKSADAYFFTICGRWNGMAVYLHVDRAKVCTARTVKKVLPAQPELPEREVEETVWDCPDSILRPTLSEAMGADDDRFATR